MIDRREDLPPAISCEWMLFEVLTPEGQTLRIGADRTTIPYFTGFELAQAFIKASELPLCGLSVASRESRELVDGILNGLPNKHIYALNPVSEKYLNILSASEFLRAIVCLAAQQDLVCFPNPVDR